MFSYGMVLYELLSGQRPVLGQHQLQIAKKLSKGIRPVLGQPEEVQLYRMQALMMECWDTKPEKVQDSPFVTSVFWSYSYRDLAALFTQESWACSWYSRQLVCPFTAPADLAQNCSWLKWEFYEWNGGRLVALDSAVTWRSLDGSGSLGIDFTRARYYPWFLQYYAVSVTTKISKRLRLWKAV